MILTSEILVKIASSNINYYKNLGYDIKVKDDLLIPVEHLPKSSNIKISTKCDFCDSKKNIIYNAYNRYLRNSKDNKYRCNICSNEVRKKTKFEKYGSYTNVEKYKKTCIDKYGGHFNKLDYFKNKISETNIEKYGFEHPMKNESVKDKRNDTCISKYGYKNPLQNIEILKKSQDTMINLYGCTYSMQSDLIKNKIISISSISKKEKIKEKDINILEINYLENLYNVKCNTCENNYNITPHIYSLRKKYNTILCTVCNPVNNGVSGGEISLLNFIKNNYKGEIILNNRNILKPYELDIYLPDLNIAFEFNGLYWHSNIYKDKKYHYNKTEMCESIGVQLVHIWEDSWIYKRDIIESMILNKLGISNRIYARKCEVRICDKDVSREFLNENHLQGNIGSKIKLGLYYNNELVCLMTFGSLRISLGQHKKENNYELLRFCNKIGTSVVGGASKLFKSFLKEFEVDLITSYADRSHSDGNLYRKLGFVLDSKTEPNYFYIIKNKRKHRFGFRKDVLVKMGFDKNKSESDIMAEMGILKIYNSGNFKFIYTKSRKLNKLFNI